MAGKRVCIIGGGIAGVGAWWTLAQQNQAAQWDVTIIHDDDSFGGHARTIQVSHNGHVTPVDTGVQFFVPLFYPSIQALLRQPGIAERVPVAPYDSLKVGCGFPRRGGQPQNWGNFGAYRTGPNFAMYTPVMYRNAQRFQTFMDIALLEGYADKTLQWYFDNEPIKYEDQTAFLDYFIYPYLSIINGYGAALADQVTFEDLVPLFANFPPKYPGLGSFTLPGAGYARFLNGASSLVDALAAQARQLTDAKEFLSATVLSVAASSTLPGPVTVIWKDRNARTITQQFDKVIITTDMLTAGGLLNNTANGRLWELLYSKYLTKQQWHLLPGKCYIHTDVSILSPDLRQQQETLQFTAWYAGQDAPPYYSMFDTYTTYLQSNIHGTVGSQGLYLTMYGYVPDGSPRQRVPDPNSVLFQEEWTHGMWLPSFMLDSKRALHMAQGKGALQSYPGQLDTGIYFAGNNTTADSLEQAFVSGEIIANYALGARFPFAGEVAAYIMYELFYREFMFPQSTASARVAHMQNVLHGAGGT